MLQSWVILLVAFSYLGLLFAIAYYGDKRADIGRSIIANPYIYALSLAVYCTAWTFYGSVGRAASSGVGFLPIYLGPTLMVALWWLVMRKIIRISKLNHITSIADFISSRYGKSQTLGGVVTIIAVMGTVPYIALQLKAISTSYLVISNYPTISIPGEYAGGPFFHDTAFYVALMLAIFTILFGTRHLVATERHEGMVAAIAFESVVKLIAFIAVGLFTTYGIFNGFGDLFGKASEIPELSKLFSMTTNGTYVDWALLMFLSMMAIMFLPRQFQVAVIENVNEDHLKKAMWLFPLYLFAINLFVLPIAFGGLFRFWHADVDADFFVLAIPMAEHWEGLALLVFIGGLSAATSMVIVATIALSTMICNDLVMPALLRLPYLRLSHTAVLTGLLLTIRRASIMLVLFLGYVYFRGIGVHLPLVSIGLISFTAVAQFAPAILGGIFWKEGTRTGALFGLLAGFFIWSYTLVFPSLVQAGLFPLSFIDDGLYGVSLLRPFHLFGLESLEPIPHALFWSMLFNVGVYVIVSLFTSQSALERHQAGLFVDAFKYSSEVMGVVGWRGQASVLAVRELLNRFLGNKLTDQAMTDYAVKRKIDWDESPEADAEFVSYAERLLAGAIGSASARVMVASVATEEPLSIDEVMNILDETQQLITYSRELEEKSTALEKASRELKSANERLQELDRMKDDFISTVTHELRTPLSSVRAFSEILYDNPDIDMVQRRKFLNIIIKESERLTRLINELLDLQKIESETMDWEITQVDLGDVIRDAVAATEQLIDEKNIVLDLKLPDEAPVIQGDRDRLMQVMLNLISNSIKFSDPLQGRISISLVANADTLQVSVSDNGIGVSREHQLTIFEKFRQVKDSFMGRPPGSGLGLTISRRIVEFHSGKIWVDSEVDQGATFSFSLPISDTNDRPGARGRASHSRGDKHGEESADRR